MMNGNAKPIDPCPHPREAWAPHPELIGKHLCRACGTVGTIMEQVGPFVLPKQRSGGQ